MNNFQYESIDDFLEQNPDHEVIENVGPDFHEFVLYPKSMTEGKSDDELKQIMEMLLA